MPAQPTQSVPDADPTMSHARVATNGVTLHVAQAGPENGPLVILLHGFPDAWFGWERVMRDLARRGYRVWAPDQRGYNLSDKPHGLDAYRLDLLADDIAGLMDAAGSPQAYLAGHDWGAAVAWWVALRHPQRVRKLAILNVPHPAVMLRHVRSSFAQMRKSWYIFFFQLPWLPEATVRANNWATGTRALTGSSRPGAFTAQDLARYREAWSQPNAMTSMMNWYRAMLQRRPHMPPNPRIHVPTLILWGAQDQFLDASMAQMSADLCDDARLKLLPNVSHWVMQEEPALVADELAAFFA